MKRLRFFLPIIAVIAALAGAFTSKANLRNNKFLVAEEWVYIGTTTANEANASFYVRPSEAPEIQCDDAPELVCKIMAVENGVSGHPELNGQNPKNAQGTFSTTLRSAP